MDPKYGRHYEVVRPRKTRRQGVRGQLDQDAPLLTAEQENELAARIQRGDAAARDQLVTSNLRLVMNIASSYPCADLGALDLDDLVQEGVLGLMRAAEDFDPNAHEARFSTYAAFWIHHYTQRLIAAQASAVRLPYYLVLLRRRYEQTRDRMLEARLTDPSTKDAAEPTMEEVAAEMGAEMKQLKYLHNVQAVTRSCSTVAPDDDPSKDEALIQEVPPERPLEVAETMQGLHSALRKLTLLERWVIRRRFRMDDTIKDALAEAEARSRRPADAPPTKADERRPYRDLARELGRPVSEIRRAERSALAKLRLLLDPEGAEAARDHAEPADREPIVAARRSA